MEESYFFLGNQMVPFSRSKHGLLLAWGFKIYVAKELVETCFLFYNLVEVSFLSEIVCKTFLFIWVAIRKTNGNPK
jgi:hypothetical protein